MWFCISLANCHAVSNDVPGLVQTPLVRATPVYFHPLAGPECKKSLPQLILRRRCNGWSHRAHQVFGKLAGENLLGWRPPASLNPVNHAPPALRPDPFSLCCGRAALEGKVGRSVSSTGPSALVVAWRPVRIGDRVSLRCLARELRFQLMLREELDVAMPWSDLRLVPRCPSGHGKGSDQGGGKGKLGHWSHLASLGVVPAQA
jgi:hypothetical protein